MPAIVPGSETASATSVSSATFSPTLPDSSFYAVGDYIQVLLRNQGGGTTIAQSGGSDWTIVAGQTNYGNERAVVAYKKVASVPEAAVTFSGANNAWHGHAAVLKGVHASVPIGASALSGVASGTNIIPCPALTTTYDNSLITRFVSSNGGGDLRISSDVATSLTTDRTRGDANALLYCYEQAGPAGALAEPDAYGTANVNGSQYWVIEWRGADDTMMQPFARSGVTDLVFFGGQGSPLGTVTHQNASNFAATVNGIATSSGAITIQASVAEASIWGSYSSFSSAENFATPSSKFVGDNVALTFPDLTGKLVSIEWRCSQNPIAAQVGSDGMVLGFKDSLGNTAVYQLAAKPNWVQDWRRTTIEVGVADTYDASGTIDWADIVAVAVMMHRVSGTGAATNLDYKNLVILDKAIVFGGNATYPASYADAQKAAASFGYRDIARIQGSTQFLQLHSLQLGHGTIKSYIDTSAKGFEFPLSFNLAVEERRYWRVDPDRVALEVYASASDTIKLTAAAAATTQPALLTVNASTSGSASYTTTGQSLIGFTPTWATNMPAVGLTYKNCDIIDFVGASVTNCTIAETRSANAACKFTASGGSMTGCTTEVTSATAYHIEVGDGGTGDFAITLTDHTFTGTAGTDKVHVTNTSGTTTITISGSTALVAGDVTSEGATVVIAAPQPVLDATVLSGSRVVLYNDTTDAELDNTAPAGTSWSKTITSGATIGDTLTLHVFKEGYEEFSTSFLYSGEDTTLLVTQTQHAAIQSLRTELSITDYTTITEFALDITGAVEIDADDADGETQKARLAIWYNGVLTTEDGARYLRGALTILSTAAIRINVDVLDLKIENISATYGLNFTDTERRLYRSDGTPIYAAASAPGSIQNDYEGVPDTVETGVSGLTGAESAQLMNLPSAATIATSVWSKELPL